MSCKICFVTGTRADYGIQSRLMLKLNSLSNVELQIVATNMHLSEAHGMTVNEIVSDGLRVDVRIKSLSDSDTAAATVKSAAVVASGLADAFDRLKPDCVVLLGDRYEMLAAAMAAHIFRIPIVHLYGGETTLGAYDDAIRHAITQLATFHLTSTEQYRRRIISMGISAENVHCIGSLGVDNISATTLLSLAELEQSVDRALGNGFLLVTFHPATLSPGLEAAQTEQLLDALSFFVNDRNILFTLPNSDTGASSVRRLIEQFCDRHPDKAVAVSSLGRRRYFSALRHCAAVVGNSSSGLIEVPSFAKPTVDIGDRQKGRAAGPTILHAEPDRDDIAAKIRTALNPAFIADIVASGVELNPYYKPNALDNATQLILSYVEKKKQQKQQ